jgi:superfamily II DNA or RNA helicase
MRVCHECKAEFDTKGEVKYHVRLEHQKTVDMVCPVTKEIVVVPRVGRDFHCRSVNCSFSTPVPQLFREHKKCFFGLVSPSLNSPTLPTNQAINQSASIFDHPRSTEAEQQFQKALKDKDLHFDNARNHIYCKKCKMILSKDFMVHMKNKHPSIEFFKHERKALKRLKEQVVPFEPLLHFIHPIHPFLVPVHGFRCNTCFEVATNSDKIKCSCPHSISPQLLQRNCKGQPYFPVYEETPTSTAEQPPSLSFDESRICGSLIKKHATASLPKIQESFKKTSGFFKDPSEKIEAEQNEYLKYFKRPPELSGDTDLEKLFKTMFSMVQNLIIPEELYVKMMDYRPLTSDESENIYISTFIKAVHFIINFSLRRFETTYYDINSNLIDFVLTFLGSPSVKALSFLLEAAFKETTVDTDMTTILLAFRYLCLDKKYNWAHAESIQHDCSRFMKLGKLVVIVRAIQGERSIAPMYLKEMQENFFKENSFTVMNSFYLYKSCSQKSVPPPKPMITRTTVQNEILINGRRIDLRFFETVTLNLYQDIQVIIDKLMLGLQLDVKLVDLDDNFRGDASLCEAHSDQLQLNAALLLHVLKTNDLRAKFVSKINHDSTQVEFKKDAISEYKKLFEELQPKLVLLDHIISGMPGRATEKIRATFVSDESTSRVAFKIEDELIFDNSYNKNRGFPTIIRSYDPKSTELQLKHLLIIRPFADLLYRESTIGYEGDLLKYVYTHEGKRCKANEIIAFVTLTLQEYGVILGFNEYRHVVEYVVRLHGLKEFEEMFLDDDKGTHHETTVMDMQMGHGGIVANENYAITTNDRRNWSLVEKYRKASQIFRVVVLKFMVESQNVAHTLKISTVPAGENNNSVNIPTEIWNAMMEKFAHVVSTTVSRDVISILPETIARNITCSEVEAKCLNGFANQSLILLRQLLRNPSVDFLSKEQQRALDVSISPKGNALVVLSTAGGKSANFLMPCLMNHSKVVLVLVPTRALEEQILKQALDKGISASNFESCKYQKERLIVLTWDQFILSFSTILSELRGLIFRIFVDEAHVIVTDQDFRDVCLDMHFVHKLDAPISLMTATATFPITLQLRNIFKLKDDCFEIRGSTDRKNIAYSCIELSNPKYFPIQVQKEFNRLSSGTRMIIYTTSIARAKELKGLLEKLEISCSIYHSKGLAENNKNVTDWFNGTTLVMIATSGFGVGIDFPRVSVVLFDSLPYSFEEYVQMACRAGRDGLEAKAVLYYYESKDKTNI